MKTRGTTIKTALEKTLSLLRPMITRRYELVVDHEKCCGCKICETICPREAISLSEAGLVEGQLSERPRLDIDDKLCSFCGECVVLCPTHALSMTVNGEPEIPVLKGQAFPALVRTMRVTEPDEPITDASFIDNCPVGAISADLEEAADGRVVSVSNVQVDKMVCINCTRCMEEGPKGVFEVVKPYQGLVKLDVSLCPAGCQACVDICPTNTITFDGAKIAIDERFCLFCGACETVCPVEDAVHIVRTGMVHTPVESAAWTTALEKLVSYQEAARELAIKGQRKRRKLVIDRELLGLGGDR